MLAAGCVAAAADAPSVQGLPWQRAERPELVDPGLIDAVLLDVVRIELLRRVPWGLTQPHFAARQHPPKQALRPRQIIERVRQRAATARKLAELRWLRQPGRGVLLTCRRAGLLQDQLTAGVLVVLGRYLGEQLAGAADHEKRGLSLGYRLSIHSPLELLAHPVERDHLAEPGRLVRVR